MREKKSKKCGIKSRNYLLFIFLLCDGDKLPFIIVPNVQKFISRNYKKR